MNSPMKSTTKSTIESLPTELMEQISQSLSEAEDLINFRKTCTTIAAATYREVWQRFPTEYEAGTVTEVADFVDKLQDVFAGSLDRIKRVDLWFTEPELEPTDGLIQGIRLPCLEQVVLLNQHTSSTQPLLDLLSNHKDTLRRVTISNHFVKCPNFDSDFDAATPRKTTASFLGAIARQQAGKEGSRIDYIDLHRLTWRYRNLLCEGDFAIRLHSASASGPASRQWKEVPGGGVLRKALRYTLEAKGHNAVQYAMREAADFLENSAEALAETVEEDDRGRIVDISSWMDRMRL